MHGTLDVNAGARKRFSVQLQTANQDQAEQVHQPCVTRHNY
jgi:hypothetical protein